ncbi:MAG: AEC family transporter [Chlorobium sp.]|uniref:AEC family transporter n=1 Tax=Chlorobium sp. TaxID=1095 RepID=UPI001DF1195B|nr:AEC family transporter [Chlorobium sp.]MBN1278816.1 AEC family transporter [Chlorobiaceae bacterium]MCF8216448.1 AEC family transporter [Chlorobium sp.]MCF8271386.1 AEC family transporter [Chlorobium sp.]MCF8287725.1 AEC family transporter [Chlorobium sp.]MCF8291297.1 AEC family transporter [Chlorobium sp.]
MENLILLGVCFLAGVLLRQMNRMPQETPAVLNGFVIHVSLPALILLYLHDLVLFPEVILIAAMPWFHFGIATCFFLIAGKIFGFSRQTTGALILTGGLGNTSFVGFPMIEAFYGKNALVYGIVVDQLGSFMVLSTLGLLIVGIFADGKPSFSGIIRAIIAFPPFMAMVAALFLMSYQYPEWLFGLLTRLGDTLAPTALFSVGFQFSPVDFRGNIRELALGLSFKLLLAPLLLTLLYTGFFGLHGQALRITLFEAAMPPMITAGILASAQGLNPRLASLMVSAGIPLSFLTLAFWWYVLGAV